VVAGLFSTSCDEPVTVLTGEEATEDAVKRSLAGRRIVHIAAHGFYCEEETRETLPYAERLANSLFMSGLYLADGSGLDDGLLTAYEVTCLDLRGIDWIVLSACGTALGPLIQGEGLFGLRRAFEIAGARTVIMALWRIDDDATRELMERIYRYRLAGASTVDAIRRAQLDRLREQRRRLNRIHPALWGGIIAEGDWR
jgi:CHAT domain-containing protein